MKIFITCVLFLLLPLYKDQTFSPASFPQTTPISKLNLKFCINGVVLKSINFLYVTHRVRAALALLIGLKRLGFTSGRDTFRSPQRCFLIILGRWMMSRKLLNLSPVCVLPRSLVTNHTYGLIRPRSESKLNTNRKK